MITNGILNMLAELRDAWSEADEANSRQIEAAIRALLAAPVMAEYEERAMATLTRNLDPAMGARLCHAVGIEVSVRSETA